MTKLFLISVVLLSATVCFAGTYSGGNGQAATPYLISTVDDLDELCDTSADWNKCFKMTRDIHFSTLPGTFDYLSAGNETTPFAGTFDGDGFCIYDLNLQGTGLFSITDTSTVIKNLGLVNVSYRPVSSSPPDYLGLLVDVNFGVITGCFATGSLCAMNVAYVGGLVGVNVGTMSRCFCTADVKGAAYVGGLVSSNGGTLASGPMSGSAVINCYFTGHVVSDNDAGGLACFNMTTITNCYSAGMVQASGVAGGLIAASFPTSAVSQSFWNLETCGVTTSAGGLVFLLPQMKTQTSFVGWDFVNTWKIQDRVTFPYLNGVGLAAPITGDIDGDGVVNLTDFTLMADNWLAG